MSMSSRQTSRPLLRFRLLSACSHLIEGGEVYAPEYGGQHDVLLVSGKIARVGQVDRSAL